MKKSIYFLTVIFALILMNTSCTKPANDDGSDGIKSSGELYPTYVGTWKNDSTYKDGVKTSSVFQLNFKIENVITTVTAKNNSVTNRIYGSWNVSGTTLNLIGDKNIAPYEAITNEAYIITTAPTAHKMVLSQGTNKYFLSK
jgi:hypothetical protein